MIPVWVLENLFSIWKLLQQYWGQAGIVLAILFASLWARTSGQLQACMDKPEPIGQVQYLTVTAQSQTKVIYKYIEGQPCPQIEVLSSASTTGQATQATTPMSQNSPPKALVGLFVGGGYLAAPYAQAGLEIGPVSVYGLTTGAIHGGGAAVRVWSW